ncbi:MAG: hypothetical protein ACKVTZ_16735 [Bacteroidia bacterium]
MKLLKILFLLFGLGYGALFAQQATKYDIIVTSAVVPVLYQNCANDVFINVPDLCSDYNPECTSQNADVIQSKEMRRKFRIIPQGTQCEIAVANQSEAGKISLGNLKFKVVPPPRPSVVAKVNGMPYFPRMAVGVGSKVMLIVEPDEGFAALVPDDAKYRFSSVELYAQTGLGVPQKIGGCELRQNDATKGIDVPLPSDAFRMPGAKTYVEFKVTRINYRGESFDAGLAPQERTLVLISR